jgi:hypothetical protein
MGLFMVMSGLAATYGITSFGPKLSLQSKIKAMKANERANASSQLPNNIIRQV